MATVTKTTVEVAVGEYTYRANVEGNAVTLYRDGALAGEAQWTGQSIEPFPETLSIDAQDKLNAAIRHNLGKAWRANTTEEEVPKTTEGLGKTQDAANQGQLGNEGDRPARQGEAEIGVGGPGHDPRTGELGGQAISPDRRPAGPEGANK